MGFNYINAETQSIFDTLNDSVSPERKRYIYKPLSTEMLETINKEITGSVSTLGKLHKINSLFPRELNKEMYDKDIIFLKTDSQEHNSLGIVFLGKFLEGDDLPDYLEMYLSKKTPDGIIIWRNLKETPGFKDIYKTENTYYVGRQHITSGASKDNRGSVVKSTMSSEITMALRSFFSKAKQEGTPEYKLVHSILNNEYDTMSTKSFFQKSDSWFTKMNGLASGKLENNIFVNSQIKDADILKPGTSIGEQYVLKRQMNIEVFADAMSSFKRGSTTNRRDFYANYRKNVKKDKELVEALKAIKEKGSYNEKTISNLLTELGYEISLETIKKSVGELTKENIEKKIKEIGDINSVEYIQKQLKKVTINDFKDHVNATKDIMKKIMYLKDKKKEYISGREIMKLIDKSNDYLNKNQAIMNELAKIIDENSKDKLEKNPEYKKPKISTYNFKIDKVEEIINTLNEKYKKIERKLVQSMRGKIDSKIKEIYTSEYETILKNTSKTDKENALGLIQHDMIRNFFDRYNEKFDLFEVMTSNRQEAKISEADIIADMVEFTYNKKGRKITGAKVRESYNTTYNPMKKDLDLRWGYYKARNSVGSKYFDNLDIEERIEMAKKYKEDHYSLFKKHSQESILGKYDTLESFKKAQSMLNTKAQYESVAGDIISRTGDKITSHINYHNNDLEVTGAMRIDDEYFKLKFDFNMTDGFNKNDWIKELESDKQASFKNMSLKAQQYIESKSPLYQKNFLLQRIITEAQKGLNENTTEFHKLNLFKSFLKGQKAKNQHFGYYKNPLDKEDRSIFSPMELIPDGAKNVRAITNYNTIYDNITFYMRNNYGDKVGYLLNRALRAKNENMKSLNELMSDILIENKMFGEINNTAFMSILNKDQIVNTTGASKQTSLIHGDAYLTSLGFTLPGVAWNKTTQRTFQAQDLLGERVLNINGQEVTLSELNATILSKTGVTGVGIRRGKYTTEEILKESINRFNVFGNLNNTTYRRGETYKTFAIGDVNTQIGDGLNSFTASFQEGMTASRGMQLTTNAIRNKEFRINLDEFDFDKVQLELGFNRKQLHEALQDNNKLNNILGKILDPELYQTIEGRKKFESIMTTMTNEPSMKLLESGSVEDLYKYYKKFAKEVGIPENKIMEFKAKNKNNRMFITRQIERIMSDLNKTTGAIAFPTTSKGKNLITVGDLIKTRNELKPELGFSISNYVYNPQTRNIELMLENIGSSAQGSKGQASGAKFTISEIYDFIKVEDNKGKEIWVDAIFNNKAEKRTQSGMMIHGVLQTAFLNAYEMKQTEGVQELANNMKELLNDLGVRIVVDKQKQTYQIDEAYLTKEYRPLKGSSNETYDFLDDRVKTITAEQFEKIIKDPLANSSKLFTERGKEILDRVTKKYGSAFYDADGNLVTGQQAHTGVLRAIHSAYRNTFYQNNNGNDFIPLTVREAKITGYNIGEEHVFGTGDIYLMKFASERVNSNSSKKKESALKVSREMIEMLRTSGYNQLSNYMQAKNTSRLTEYMGGLYASMTNAEMLNKIYDHNKNFDIKEINKAISETIKNGVLLDLDTIDSNDYFVNSDDRYLKHELFKTNSSLGKAMQNKQLAEVVDGKLVNEVNIVINDTNLNAFTNEVKKAMDRTLEFVSKNKKGILNEYGYKDYDINNVQKAITYFKNLDTQNEIKIKPDDYTAMILSKASDFLSSKSFGTSSDTVDMNITARMLKMLEKNVRSGNGFALKQLQTMFKTGSIIATIGLKYDVSETDDSIVPSTEFTRLQKIAQKSYESNQFDKSSKNLKTKVTNKDKTIIDDIYNDIFDYYSGTKDYSNIKASYDLVQKLNVSDKLIPLKEKLESVNTQNILLSQEKLFVNEQIAKYHSYKDISEEEYIERIKLWDENMKQKTIELNKEKAEIASQLQDKNITSEIKKHLDKVIFGKEKLSDNKSFSNFFKQQLKEQFNTNFDLIEDYIKIPDTAKQIFQKKGTVVSKQKFKIDSSFVANPLEGSDLLTKFEEIMFKNVKDKKTLDSNIKELEQFLSSSIVNENLFKDVDGKNTLDDVKGTGRTFQEGLEKARQAFNRNIAEISEVTITEKQFTHSFRKKDHNWKDFFGDVDINKNGFTREMSFLSRHPQQTYNHMGGVMNIVVDSKILSSSKTKNNGQEINRFAKATLSYFPKEKNQAGVITLGKKTMLYRRGDHDGDKIQQAYLDFIDDTQVKFDTEARAFVDLQIKNNTFGEWDDIKGRFTKFTGKILDKDGSIVDLKNKKTDEVYTYLNNVLGYDETSFNMHTKGFLNFAHVVRERTKKEFKKHFNEIYEIEAVLSDYIDSGKVVSNDQINILENTLKKAFNPNSNIERLSTVGSKYAEKSINNSFRMIDALRNQDKDFDIHSVDLIASTGLYKILKADTPYKDSDSLLKDILKDVDKLIDRGSFDTFYKEKNSKAIFDELSGIRNTGITHSYATKIRKTATDVLNMNPLDIMGKIGNVRGLSVENLKEIKTRQKYFADALDLFADNMIESAISAKHGLTLGGLEGSKIFTNTLLGRNSANLNNMILDLFDESFIKQTNDNKPNTKLINLMEGIASFKKGFDDKSDKLEEIVERVEADGLDKQILFKMIETGNNDFKKSYTSLFREKDIRKSFNKTSDFTKGLETYRKQSFETGITDDKKIRHNYVQSKQYEEDLALYKPKYIDKTMKKYSNYKKEYKQALTRINTGLYNSLKESKYVNSNEFEMFKGLNLYGELLIQNDPGLEYEASDALELFKQYRDHKISYEELMTNKEIINLKHQAYTSLGSAAAISNVSLMKGYINAYQKKYLDTQTDDEVKKYLQDNLISKIIEYEKTTNNKNYTVDQFDINDFFDIRTLSRHKNEVTKTYSKVLSEFASSEKFEDFKIDIGIQRQNNANNFYSRILSNTNDPISDYAMAMNINNAIFNHSGKSGEDSYKLLKEYYKYGMNSLNESPLSKSIKSLRTSNNQFLEEVINKYSQVDSNFQDFSVDDILKDLISGNASESQKLQIVRQINDAINSAIFEKNKNNFNIANPKTMTKIVVGQESSLGYIDKALYKQGRLIIINPQDGVEGIKNVINTRNKLVYIDNLDFLTKKGKFNMKGYNSLKGLFENKRYNFYVTKDIAQRFVTSDERYIKSLLPNGSKFDISQDMLNAYKYLGEEINVSNAIKRLDNKFDSALAARTAVEVDIANNKEIYASLMEDTFRFGNYKTKLSDVLSNIITDFKHVDLSLSNRNVDEMYLNLAKTFVMNKMDYKSISESLGSSMYIKKAQFLSEQLKYIVRNERKWLNEMNINQDMFKTMAAMELMNNADSTIKDSSKFLNESLLRVAKALSNKEISSSHFKYNDTFVRGIATVSKNKGKVGIAGLIASAGMLLAKTAKPYFVGGNKNYIVGQTTKAMTEAELLNKLNFTNGLKTNLANEDLKTDIPQYVSIIKKNYF